MKENELIYFMSYKNKTVKPLFVTNINSQYILAAYQGSISEYDILIKYRQKIKAPLENLWVQILNFPFNYVISHNKTSKYCCFF